MHHISSNIFKWFIVLFKNIYLSSRRCKLFDLIGLNFRSEVFSFHLTQVLCIIFFFFFNYTFLSLSTAWSSRILLSSLQLRKQVQLKQGKLLVLLKPKIFGQIDILEISVPKILKDGFFYVQENWRLQRNNYSIWENLRGLFLHQTHLNSHHH